MESIPAFYFDPRRLMELADRHREAFQNAEPFQHVVFDDFLPAEVVDLLVREFPGPEDIAWEVHGPGRTTWAHDRHVDKLATSDETKFGAFTRHFMGQLNSGVFVSFLERLTGMPGIFPDVTYNNCGLHSTGRGGRLMMHTDVNRHPLGTRMHQYLNLLLYLNPDWPEEYGGHLELWNRRGEPVHRVLPSANRVVIFNTGTRSLHGHPHPLTCPADRRRNSIAVYYYLRERPASEDYLGAQRSVHWVPTTREDRAFATEGRSRGLAGIARLEGHTISVPADLLPFEVPSEMVDPASGKVPLTFLTARERDDAGAFAATHLRAAMSRHASGPSDFLATYQPLAVLGSTSGSARACLVDVHGEVFMVTGPECADLVGIGYLDEIVDTITKAGG